MNLTVIKPSLCLILMIAFLIMAFITKDVVNSHLFTSLGIVTGTFASKFASNQNTTTDEKY